MIKELPNADENTFSKQRSYTEIQKPELKFRLRQLL